MRNYDEAADELVDQLQNGDEKEARADNPILALAFDDGFQDPFMESENARSLFPTGVSSLEEGVARIENSHNKSQSHYSAGAAMAQLLANLSGENAFSLARQLGEHCALGHVDPLFYKSKMIDLAGNYIAGIKDVMFAFAVAYIKMNQNLILKYGDAD